MSLTWGFTEGSIQAYSELAGQSMIIVSPEAPETVRICPKLHPAPLAICGGQPGNNRVLAGLCCDFRDDEPAITTDPSLCQSVPVFRASDRALGLGPAAVLLP